MFGKILIANDGSEGGTRARACALKLAHRLKAELHMICVEELPRMPATIDEVVEDKLDENHRFQQVIAQALFLRAERGADGTRTFKLKEGEPLQTSFGKDLYDRIFEVQYIQGTLQNSSKGDSHEQRTGQDQHHPAP